MSGAFTVVGMVNIVVMSTGTDQPPAWVTYPPLPPLSLLVFSGLYVFMLPYAAKWRSAQSVV